MQPRIVTLVVEAFLSRVRSRHYVVDNARKLNPGKSDPGDSRHGYFACFTLPFLCSGNFGTMGMFDASGITALPNSHNAATFDWVAHAWMLALSLGLETDRKGENVA